jgi:hypothetical protein
MPGLSLLPLYGLYPGEGASGEPGYHPVVMHTWAIGAGIVFLALAVAGLVFKNSRAATAFLILFILSTVVSCARMVGGLH